jgi:hypothetical protein
MSAVVTVSAANIVRRSLLRSRYLIGGIKVDTMADPPATASTLSAEQQKVLQWVLQGKVN